jgi:hypothetical protein
MFVEMKKTMKRKIAFIGFTVLAAGFTAFGLVSQHKESQNECAPSESKQSTKHSLATLSQFPSLNYIPNKNVTFMVKGQFTHSTSIDQLRTAQKIEDFYPDYPSNWISDYISVDITLFQNGVETRATSSSNVLSTKQKEMLSNAKLFADVMVEVTYNNTNSITNSTEVELLKKTFTSVPKTQASFIGGRDKMNVFLKANAASELMSYIMDKTNQALLDDSNNGNFNIASLQLSIGTNGEVIDATVIQTCGSLEMDNLLLALVNGMPKWEPARTEGGKPIEQKLELSIGQMGC